MSITNNTLQNHIPKYYEVRHLPYHLGNRYDRLKMLKSKIEEIIKFIVYQTKHYDKDLESLYKDLRLNKKFIWAFAKH